MTPWDYGRITRIVIDPDQLFACVADKLDSIVDLLCPGVRDHLLGKVGPIEQWLSAVQIADLLLAPALRYQALAVIAHYVEAVALSLAPGLEWLEHLTCLAEKSLQGQSLLIDWP